MTTLERRPLIGPNGPLVDPSGATLYSAVTPGGIPYPAPTDPVSQGAANMAAIATFLDPAETLIYRSGGQNAVTNTWTMAGGFSATRFTKGAGLTFTAAGIQVAAAGRYRCEAWAVIPAGAGQRRGIAAGLTTGMLATDAQVLEPPAGGASNALTISQTISAPAGGVITLYMYQDSGATLVATNISLSVQREP